MRVAFFGTSEFAVPSLERLAGSAHEVVLCVTQPDRPQGRGLKLGASPVKQAAQRLGIPVAQLERLTVGALEGRPADVGALASYGQIVKPDVLERFPHGMLGIHPSLLPKYRGAAPVAWALLNGETRTGLTIFKMNERLDAGDMLLQEPVEIGVEEDAAALTARLAALGAEALLRTLDQVASGRAAFRPQDEAQASYAPKLTKAQGRIDWSQPAAVVVRQVRALTPWPGAATSWRGEPLKVWRAAPGMSPAGGNAAPGTVTGVEAERLTVAAGTGHVELLEVQPAGRRKQTVREFLAGHNVQVGDQLGQEGEGRMAKGEG